MPPPSVRLPLYDRHRQLGGYLDWVTASQCGVELLGGLRFCCLDAAYQEHRRRFPDLPDDPGRVGWKVYSGLAIGTAWHHILKRLGGFTGDPHAWQMAGTLPPGLTHSRQAKNAVPVRVNRLPNPRVKMDPVPLAGQAPDAASKAETKATPGLPATEPTVRPPTTWEAFEESLQHFRTLEWADVHRLSTEEWTTKTLHAYFQRPFRNQQEQYPDPDLVDITAGDQFGTGYEVQFECQWRHPSGHLVTTWQTYLDLMPNPAYLKLMKERWNFARRRFIPASGTVPTVSNPANAPSRFTAGHVSSPVKPVKQREATLNPGAVPNQSVVKQPKVAPDPVVVHEECEAVRRSRRLANKSH